MLHSYLQYTVKFYLNNSDTLVRNHTFWAKITSTIFLPVGHLWFKQTILCAGQKCWSLREFRFRKKDIGRFVHDQVLWIYKYHRFKWETKKNVSNVKLISCQFRLDRPPPPPHMSSSRGLRFLTEYTYVGVSRSILKRGNNERNTVGQTLQQRRIAQGHPLGPLRRLVQGLGRVAVFFAIVLRFALLRRRRRRSVLDHVLLVHLHVFTLTVIVLVIQQDVQPAVAARVRAAATFAAELAELFAAAPLRRAAGRAGAVRGAAGTVRGVAAAASSCRRRWVVRCSGALLFLGGEHRFAHAGWL